MYACVLSRAVARAYVGSRALDYVLAHWPHVIPDQIALTGHSRNGKQSLVLAATDERVTATVGSSPGVPIASP
jgi:cephalosporin-C deacetylase-like acetyl esterase